MEKVREEGGHRGIGEESKGGKERGVYREGEKLPSYLPLATTAQQFTTTREKPEELIAYEQHSETLPTHKGAGVHVVDMSQVVDSPWAVHHDVTTGFDFYQNTETGETTWEMPEELLNWAETIAASDERAAAEEQVRAAAERAAAQQAQEEDEAYAAAERAYAEAARAEQERSDAASRAQQERVAAAMREEQKQQHLANEVVQAEQTRAATNAVERAAAAKQAAAERQAKLIATQEQQEEKKRNDARGAPPPHIEEAEQSVVSVSVDDDFDDEANLGPLAEGWRKKVHTKKNTVYFVNKLTGASSDKRPVDKQWLEKKLADDEAKKEADAARELAKRARDVHRRVSMIPKPQWTAHRDHQSNREFFINDSTEESTWVKPEALVAIYKYCCETTAYCYETLTDLLLNI